MSMNSQDKYYKCVSILSEIHDIVHIMIETGVVDELDAYSVLEEALNVLRQVDKEAPVVAMSPGKVKEEKKTKKLLH
jgi:hypothetical protein